MAVRTAVAATRVPCELLECDPALADTAAFCAHYGYPESHSANTIVVESRRPAGLHAACVVLATTRLDVNHKVRELLGVRKLSFARPEQTMALTGMEVGGVTPLALPDGLPLYVDARIMALDWVILGGGSRSLKLKADPAILVAAGGVVVEDLAQPFPGGPVIPDDEAVPENE
jgi:prolyl-tRNA editing enzyme YbaK/EbsC (Cys-tRNA(Pro) deacylase)